MSEDKTHETSQNEATKKDVVVVAEDSPPNRKILVHLLEKLGYEVVSCSNGKEAWQSVEKLEGHNLVAIISDVMMPEMDGIEFLKKVRASDSYSKLPFVLVTAVSDREYIVEAKAQNVDGYILKPVTFQRVYDKLTELFPEKDLPKLAG